VPGGLYVATDRLYNFPLAFLTTQTNLANLQAAEHQHLAKTIAPRLRRRDEKLNEQLVPLFDPTGRQCGVLPKPKEAQPLTSCVLAGPNHEYLYITNGDTIFRRKLSVE
jgi:hypothetical protein